MRKRWFDANGGNHQSFEQSFTEISAIEPITKFIKIELQELLLDSMVHIGVYDFCIGYGSVYPRKYLACPSLGLTTRASAFSTASLVFTCAVESSMMTSVDSFLQTLFMVSFMVSASRFSMTTIAQMASLASFFPFFGASKGSLSTITKTFALRWLPLPRLSGSSPSGSSSVVKWASSSSAIPQCL